MKNPQILFLEDTESRVDIFKRNTGLDVWCVKRQEDFERAINSQTWDYICLDHDLYGMDYDGYRAALYIAENRLLIGDGCKVIVHSSNPHGVTKIMGALAAAFHVQPCAIPEMWNNVSWNGQNLVFTV